MSSWGILQRIAPAMCARVGAAVSGASRINTSGRKASTVAVAAAFAGLLGAAPDARAAFILQLTSSVGGGTVVIQDNLAGDVNPALNQIIAVAPLPGFSTVNINVAVSNTPGSPSGASLQISNTVQRDAAGPATLTIQTTATGYTVPLGGGLSIESAGGGQFTNHTGASSLTFNSYADPSGAPFGTAVGTPNQSFATFGAGGTDGYTFPDASTPFASATPYSISNTAVVTLSSPSAQSSFTGSTIVVPEPASLGVLALGGLALLHRRRRTA